MSTAHENEIDLTAAAEHLGYERIEWTTTDDGTACYVVYVSSSPIDRRKDDPEGYFVARDDRGLQQLAD